MGKLQLLTSIVALTCLLISAGCDSRLKPTATNGEKAGGDEHVHSDGTTHKDHGKEGHTHGSGPHDGTVADWGGGKFHVEFTVNHDKQEATVYVMGNDEKTPFPIDASEITLNISEPRLTAILTPTPLAGEPEGKASRFVGKHEGLGVVREYEGSISGVVNGTPYSGNFKEEAHDHQIEIGQEGD